MFVITTLFVALSALVPTAFGQSEASDAELDDQLAMLVVRQQCAKDPSFSPLCAMAAPLATPAAAPAPPATPAPRPTPPSAPPASAPAPTPAAETTPKTLVYDPTAPPAVPALVETKTVPVERRLDPTLASHPVARRVTPIPVFEPRPMATCGTYRPLNALGRGGLEPVRYNGTFNGARSEDGLRCGTFRLTPIENRSQDYYAIAVNGLPVHVWTRNRVRGPNGRWHMMDVPSVAKVDGVIQPYVGYNKVIPVIPPGTTVLVELPTTGTYRLHKYVQGVAGQPLEFNLVIPGQSQPAHCYAHVPGEAIVLTQGMTKLFPDDDKVQCPRLRQR